LNVAYNVLIVFYTLTLCVTAAATLVWSVPRSDPSAVVELREFVESPNNNNNNNNNSDESNNDDDSSTNNSTSTSSFLEPVPSRARLQDPSSTLFHGIDSEPIPARSKM
jgi:hypothetical protein